MLSCKQVSQLASQSMERKLSYRGTVRIIFAPYGV